MAIAHVSMGRGGSESIAMWGIAALKDEADVTLLTAGSVDRDDWNAWYGTSLRASDFQVRQAPVLPGMRRSARLAALRGTMFQRFCRRVAGDYDLLISAYNPLDFGVPAIHYISDFMWDMELREQLYPRPGGGLSPLHRQGRLRRAYLGFAGRWRRSSGRDLFAGEDLLVANSRWTAALLREHHPQARISIVYPPVVGDFEDRPWEQRESAFVFLGRAAYEKRIEHVVEILSRVRQRGHAIHLHVIGPIGDDPYGRMIRGLLSEQSDWITMEGTQVGAAKARLLSGHRYALSACAGEAFGIAVAEQAKAGCIPFVHAEGGAAEIVGDPQLCFRSIDEAVDKIESVLKAPARQQQLSTHLAKRAAEFGVHPFQEQFRAQLSGSLSHETLACPSSL